MKQNQNIMDYEMNRKFQSECLKYEGIENLLDCSVATCQPK